MCGRTRRRFETLLRQSRVESPAAPFAWRQLHDFFTLSSLPLSPYSPLTKIIEAAWKKAKCDAYSKTVRRAHNFPSKVTPIINRIFLSNQAVCNFQLIFYVAKRETSPSCFFFFTCGRVQDLGRRPDGVVGPHGLVHLQRERVQVLAVWRVPGVGVAPGVQDVLTVAVEGQEELGGGIEKNYFQFKMIHWKKFLKRTRYRCVGWA